MSNSIVPLFSSRLSLRTNLLNIPRRLFCGGWGEKWLVRRLASSPDNPLWKSLRPSNYLYPPSTIRYAIRDRLQYALDLRDYQDWVLYFYSFQDSSRPLLSYLSKGMTAFDVGANVGQTAMAMAQTTQKLVYCFEPHPATFFKLKKNLSLNSFLPIKAEQLGLGQKPGWAQMGENINHSGSNCIQNHGNISVPLSCIDEYIESNQISACDFIKIDTEGYELEVLKGAENTLKKFHPILVIELDENNLEKYHTSSNELITYLLSFGYKLSDLHSNQSISLQHRNSLHTDILAQ